MPDKVIINHYKRLKKIEEQIQEDIDKIMAGLDVDELIADPEKSFIHAVAQLENVIRNKYFEQAIALGTQWGEEIKKHIRKDDEIVVETGTKKQKEEAFDDNPEV